MSNEEIAKILGKNVKCFREKRDYSQMYLSEIANVSNTTISKLENGKYIPSMSFLFSIARSLQVELDDLFCGVQILDK